MNDEIRGKFLQELRKEKGLTQQELGDLIHYSDKAISKWERGLSFPNNPEVLDQLSKVFDVSIEEFLYGERKNIQNKEKVSSNMESIYRNIFYKYKKLLLCSILSILIFAIIILIFIYFTFIRNTIKSYRIIGESERFISNNSTLLLTDKIDILNFVKIESKNNEKITYIRLYYMDNVKQFSIFEGTNDNYYIEEFDGYTEYNLNNLINYDLYLEVYYDNNETETIELELQNRFINSDIFSKKVSEISNDGVEYNTYNAFLIKEGFSLCESGLKREFDDVVVYYNEPSSIVILYDKSGIEEKIEANLKYDSIIYEKLGQDGLIDRIEYSFSKKNKFDKDDKFKTKYINYLKYLKENYN